MIQGASGLSSTVQIFSSTPQQSFPLLVVKSHALGQAHRPFFESDLRQHGTSHLGHVSTESAYSLSITRIATV